MRIAFACSVVLGATACSGPNRSFVDDSASDVADAVMSVDASDSGNAMDTGSHSDTGTSSDAPVADVSNADVDNSGDMTIVYAHSHSILYSYDPRTRVFTTIGPFVWPSGYDVTNPNSGTGMTDLAVDAMGHLVGVTWDALFTIDPTNANLALVTMLPGGGQLGRQYVGLTYVPVGTLDPNREILVGGASDGTYWGINPANGDAIQLGTLSDSWAFDGDLVSVAGAGTYATVRPMSDVFGMATTSLVQFDLHTGTVTVIGDTGFRQLWGIAYWRATLYGFSGTGQFVSINSMNGAGMLINTPVGEFWGAGSTTIAPTAPP